MGRLEKNSFANLFGTVWVAALNVLSVPLYIKLMGVEAFGLTGFYLTLQSILAILDLGIGTTLNREIARFDADKEDARKQHDLVFTLQIIYWLLALLMGAAVFILAPVIAGHWVKVQSLSIETVSACIRMMAIAMASQFPFVFYQCGLLGLQRQVLFNGLYITISTLRALGTLLALWFILPTPEIFFAAQIIAGAAGTSAGAVLLWRCLPRADERPGKFRFELVRNVWGFSAAYTVNSVASLGLLKGDRIILSRLLPLEMFGYYTLAQSVINGLYAIIISIDGALFPQLAGLVARDNQPELAKAYHRGAQLMSVTLIPVAVMLIIFSREILTLWTGDPAIVVNTHLVLTLLAGGMLLHGLMQAPYYLQVAYGWWRLISYTNLILLPSIIALYFIMARNYGGPGVAWVWILLNTCYLITMPLMHRRFLKGERRRWLFEDVCLPLSGVLVVEAVTHWLFPPNLSRIELLTYLSLAGVLALAVAALLTSQLRNSLIARLRRTAELFVA